MLLGLPLLIVIGEGMFSGGSSITVVFMFCMRLSSHDFGWLGMDVARNESVSSC